VVAWWSVGSWSVTQKTSRPLCRYCINQRELLRPVAAVVITGRNEIWKRLQRYRKVREMTGVRNLPSPDAFDPYGVLEGLMANTQFSRNLSDWTLVAHMSNQGGMFDGQGDLTPTYSYGTYADNPQASTADFQKTFSIQPNSKILFVTGDQ